MNRLRSLRAYTVDYFILDARDYGALLARKRLCIVGIQKDHAHKVALPPRRIAATYSFEDILEKGTVRPTLSSRTLKRVRSCAETYQHPVFLTINLNRMFCHGSAFPPTLLKNGEGIYWSKQDIVLTLREQMRLQGIPEWFSFPKGTTDRQCKQLVGNSISVHVLPALFRELAKVFKHQG